MIHSRHVLGENNVTPTQKPKSMGLESTNEYLLFTFLQRGTQP